MTRFLAFLLGTTAFLFGGTAFAAKPALRNEPPEAHTELSAKQVQFLWAYESIRAALAGDDLERAKAAAATIADWVPATILAKSSSLNTARIEFKKLSAEAESLVRGHSGYYVMHCPMVDSDWVQSTALVSNPYLGARMATCGHVR